MPYYTKPNQKAHRARPSMMIAYTLVLLVLLAMPLLLSVTPTNAAPTAPAVADPSLWVTDKPVYAITPDPANNRLYIGGDFTYVGPPTGRSASIDATTGLYSAAWPLVRGGTVSAIVSDGAGGWYIGGNFTTVGGLPRVRLAHVLANNTVDPAWTPGVNAAVLTIAVSGGVVYVGGSFASVNGPPVVQRNRLAAFDAATGALTAWNPNVSGGDVRAIVVSGTNVYVGGAFTGFGSPVGQRNRLAALDVTTGVPTAWDPNVNGQVNTIVVSGGNVYAGGAFQVVNGTTVALGGTARNRLAAFAEADNLVTAWDPNINGNVNTMVLNGTALYIGGTFGTVNTGPTVTRNRLASIDIASGAVDPAWNPNAGNAVNTLTVVGTTVYVGGQFTQIGTAVGVPATQPTRNFLAALSTADGQPTAWIPNADAQVNALAATAATVYAGGDFNSVNGLSRNRIAALDLTTGAAIAWYPGAANAALTNQGAQARVNVIKVIGTSVYVGGQFSVIGGVTRNRLAALSATDATVLNGFDPNANGEVKTFDASATTLYVGGAFSGFGAPAVTTRNRLAAFNLADGTLVAGWNPNVSAQVNSVVVSGATVYAGGQFTVVNGATVAAGGTARNRLAAFDGTTGIVTAWDPNVNGGDVNTLAVAGTTVYAGGVFNFVNGATVAAGGSARNRLAAFDSTLNTANVTPWNPNVNSGINALAVDGANTYVGGLFATIGTPAQTISSLAAVDTATGTPFDWKPDTGVGGTVNTVAVSGNVVFVGTNLNGALTPEYGLAAFGGVGFTGVTTVTPVTVTPVTVTPVTVTPVTVTPVTVTPVTVTPVTPGTTVTPETVTPVTPGTTVTPVTPGTTVTPVTPGTTVTPVTPGTTVTPTTGTKIYLPLTQR